MHNLEWKTTTTTTTTTTTRNSPGGLNLITMCTGSVMGAYDIKSICVIVVPALLLFHQ